MTDFKAKMHQIRFRLGLRPIYPAGGAYSVPQTRSWIWGRFAAQQGERMGYGIGGKGEEKRGRRGKWRGGKLRAPSYC